MPHNYLNPDEIAVEPYDGRVQGININAKFEFEEPPYRILLPQGIYNFIGEFEPIENARHLIGLLNECSPLFNRADDDGSFALAKAGLIDRLKVFISPEDLNPTGGDFYLKKLPKSKRRW